jgi:dTDP-glucose 4,6-dehydratase
VKRTVLITGGAGFIGSNLIRHWLKEHPEDFVVNLDCLTYAANHDFIAEFLRRQPDYAKRYFLALGDIRDRDTLKQVFDNHQPSIVIHLAAESHVDRSLESPAKTFEVNVIGTINLLEAARRSGCRRFHYVSTDEVFGQLKNGDAPFDEYSPLQPRSPYAASKAAADMAVLSYGLNYGMHVTVSNCSNNFGKNSHEEKFIPKIVGHILRDEPVPIYGTGKQVRDWLFVEDHCRAIDQIVEKGFCNARYCIGGNTEKTNLEIVEIVRHMVSVALSHEIPLNIKHTQDRPHDDFRYAVNCDKLNREFGWEPDTHAWTANMAKTVAWCISNQMAQHKLEEQEEMFI